MTASVAFRSSFVACILAAVLAAQTGTKPPPAPAVEKAPPVKTAVTKDAPAKTPGKEAAGLVGGRDALRACRELAAKVKGLRGPTRDAALEEAAKAYEQVGIEHAADKATAAQAWYEAAELWRRGNDLAPAEAAYAKAVENDRDRYAERSWLEVANLQRRSKRYDDAVATYKKVIELNPSSSRAHDARLWIGRTLQQKGTMPEAIVAYGEAVERAPALLDRIEATDWLVKALVHVGDLDKAAATFATLETAVKDAEGPDSERVHKAFEGMTSKRSIEKARDKQTKAHKDAEQAEAKLRR